MPGARKVPRNRILHAAKSAQQTRKYAIAVAKLRLNHGFPVVERERRIKILSVESLQVLDSP